jgi:hypothetical protein
VVLQWTAVTGAAGYRIYRDATLVGQETSTSFAATSLTNGTTYGFSVTAYNVAGESARSNVVYVMPTAGASAPVPPPPSTSAAPSSGATSPSTYTVTPSSGPITGGTMIMITGANLPHAGMSIMGSFGTILGSSSTAVLAVTAPHALAGTFDVTLYGNGQEVLVIPAAFTYVLPPSAASPTPAPTSTTAPATAPTTAPLAPSPTSPPTTTAPAPAPAATAPAAGSGGSSTGLQTVPLPAASPLADIPAGLWDAIMCRSSSCRG